MPCSGCSTLHEVNPNKKNKKKNKSSRTITNKEKFDPKEFKKTTEEQRKNEQTAKRMHGQFARDMENTDTNKTWR